MVSRTLGDSDKVNTSLLACIATLLITNSHLDHLYPDSRFGTGGSLGVALFFLLSGYGLALSLTTGRGSLETFIPYLIRRIARIYPGLILVVITAISLKGQWHELRLINWVSMFIWPTWYWFISAIVIFYIPFYWLGKLTALQLLITIILLFIPYFYCYFSFLDLSYFSIEDGYFKWFIYFQLMLFGAWLAKSGVQRFNINLAAVGFVGSTLAFYLLKVLLFKFSLGSLQFLTHAILFPFVFFSFQFLTASHAIASVKKWRLGWMVSFLGGLTLEIYLVQVPLIPFLSKQGWQFPVGLITALLLIAIFSPIVSWFSKKIVYVINHFGVKVA